jgi:hypothetical protein
VETDKIFIVGCNRTGTSLLRQILNKSEQICIVPETHFLRRFSDVGDQRNLRRFAPLSDDRNVARLVDYIYTDHQSWKAAYWQWLKRNGNKAEFTRRILATDRSERAIFTLVMEFYCEANKASGTDGCILGEKTPTHMYYVPTLLEWFPRAKIIHTFRDPRAITVSKIRKVSEKGKEGPKRKFSSVPGWLIEPFADSIEVVHMTKSWLDAARLHTTYERLYPERYALLRFEDLISSPQEHIGRICNYLGVTFEPTMLEEIDVIGSSYQADHRGWSGFDQQTINRWKDSINPFVKAWFSTIGRKQLKRFGYSVS